MKLKKSLEEVNDQLGFNWTLKMNMKENQLRVAEKIQEYIDHKQKKVDHLDLFTK